MDPSAQEDILIRLAIQHVTTHGEWPKLEVVHRQIHQGTDLSVNTLEVARRLAPKPFVGGGYTWLGETFAPDPELIARVDEGRQLLNAIMLWINLARAKYRTADGKPDITSAEFVEETGLDPRLTDAVRVVLGWFSDTTDASHWNEEGWTITVDDKIVSWPLLASVEDLLAEWSRRQQRHEQLGPVADDAKHRLLRATGRLAQAPVHQEATWSWTDKPWARTVLWIGGVLGGVAAGIFIWSWVR